MYRVPEDLDFTSILGADLNIISLGRYDVQFSFDAKAIICLQSKATLLQNGMEIATWDDESNWSSLSFQRLLNQTVESFSVPHDQLIQIQFTNDLTLQLHDSSDQYESMQIYFSNEELPAIII
ncbi:hypothetical protein [Ectopseudomonas composti]|uniref:hypothetical protein n=1 Tax=Ectopseudomonas composti TaxID=658457 RepID=UPI00077433FD|nr:hypothetical protein [Pseudomonas composti]